MKQSLNFGLLLPVGPAVRQYWNLLQFYLKVSHFWDGFFFHIFIGKTNAKSDETVNFYLKCTFLDQKTKQAKNSNWIVSFNNRDNPPRDLVERTLYTSLKLINSSSTIPKKMTPRNLCRFDQITYLIIRDIYIYVLWLLKCQFRLPRFEFLIWQSRTQSRHF